MNLEIFSVYDIKAKAYLPPFFMPRIDLAIRLFSNSANDPGHAFGANPEDYVLFHIGCFDDDNAKIKTQTPNSLGIAIEMVKAKKDPAQLDIPFDLSDLKSVAPDLEQKKGNSEDKTA